MPIKRPQLANNELYHLTIRAAGDTLLFRGESDYFRAIFSLYEFNNDKGVVIRDCRLLARQRKHREPFSVDFNQRREPFLELMSFCLMPNHLHLLVRQIFDNGIVDFMRKFGAGFAGFFNRKYNRKGPLFSKYRAVHIQDDAQLKTAFVYIHTNPISIVEPGWKEKGIRDFDKAMEFLKEYRWSSFFDYIGKNNFPSVTERDFLLSALGGQDKCREYLFDWLKFKCTENRSR